MTILHIKYSYKIHVFMKSFVYHSICTVFTILFVGSLSSYIFGLNCHYLYWNIYIYIHISYMWYLPCYIKGFNLSMSIKSKQWFSVMNFSKLKTGLYQEMSENKSILQEKCHSFKTVFQQQILKRNLHKQRKISEEKSLPNKIQIEISANKYLTPQFLPNLSNEKPLPNNT